MDIEHYDYTDFIEKSYIGAKQIGGDWVEYGISSGWTNTLMLDAYGGMTVGGAGFEVDGNGIFPYTRLTSSSYMSNGSQFYLLGLLDNAYHPTTGGWECDDNTNWAWFVGMKFPQLMDDGSPVYLHKDTENASFVVMYNDMASIDTTADDYTIHQMSSSDWHIVFEVDKDGAKGGGGGGGSTDVYPSDNTPLTDLSNGSAGTSELYSRADHRHPLLNAYPPETHTHDDIYYQKTYIDNNMPSISEIPKKSDSAPPMDTTNGAIGTDNGKYARADHSHPQSNLYATSGHQHDYSNTYASKSHTHNELESDGVMRKNNVAQTSKNVITDTNGKITTTDPSYTKTESDNKYPLKSDVPSSTSTRPSSDTVLGDAGTDTGEYANANHSHPISNIYAIQGHDHNGEYVPINSNIPANLIYDLTTYTNIGRGRQDTLNSNIDYNFSRVYELIGSSNYTYKFTPTKWNWSIGETLSVKIKITDNGTPVTSYSFNVILPDGQTVSATTDSNGEYTATYTASSEGIHVFQANGYYCYLYVKQNPDQHNNWSVYGGSSPFGTINIYYNDVLGLAELRTKFEDNQARSAGADQDCSIVVPLKYRPSDGVVVSTISSVGNATLRVRADGAIIVRFLSARTSTSYDYYFNMMWHY